MFSFVIKYWIEILFSLIVTLITHLYRKIYKYVKDINNLEKYACIDMKFYIMDKYEKINNKGYMTMEEKESITELYDIYKNLECSNVVENLIQNLENIPIR